jgi:SulP family sulfate permease
LIKRAEKICDVNVLEDPDYFVAIDDYNNLMANKKV